ncbi:MAG: nuclear transport factor 2 family protein [Candidatus Manganitrophus sp.]|nr:nuclear transport factor 2 family protein [Candidatus Manganitrophus sp.]MDC4226083.1 nuclear transport factor 2 family protein [Candidatus Manganitrophus sp.]WDT72662.1 MAG: nuclear transport factor 2 family protein [Candidatus Manganitrophus sp.]WDT79875.1 MAG: nuclear transport factor 2 family protein [Candidatus Manganitrophus sp.]
MDIKLPPPILAFFKAFNTHNANAVVALFTGDALVTDEGKDYHGAAIKKWIDRVNTNYNPTAEVVDLASSGGAYVVTARVSGTFPGSPIQLRYHFTLKNDKIAALICGT